MRVDKNNNKEDYIEKTVSINTLTLRANADWWMANALAIG